MTNLTILPHSSASVERIFSLMNSVKTKQTNFLTVEAVKSRILAKQLVTTGKNHCTTWMPRKKLIRDLESGESTLQSKNENEGGATDSNNGNG